jgi:hypothetical protein
MASITRKGRLPSTPQVKGEGMRALALATPHSRFWSGNRPIYKVWAPMRCAGPIVRVR